MEVGVSSRRREAPFTEFTPALGVRIRFGRCARSSWPGDATPATPIVLAANRDELIARPSAPPGVLSESPLIVGGRDLVAGGTWLAVAADGADLRGHQPPSRARARRSRRIPSRRSRGEIPLALLDRRSGRRRRDRLARTRARALQPGQRALAGRGPRAGGPRRRLGPGARGRARARPARAHHTRCRRRDATRRWRC